MPVQVTQAADALARLDRYSAIVDARSQSEFALDHLPGAVNWPSLSDAERAEVGTDYKQVSAFDARKRGAAMVARNIAAHVERHLADTPRDWSPLVYCWRGGQRSGALATVLGQIGFRVEVLEGGYRAFRREVTAELARLPSMLSLVVVCGTTGSGKTRLLEALAERGTQVLDLEALACHRGSVLGLVPGTAQPSQRFDTRVWDALRRFDPGRIVVVESESRKVGDLRACPEALVDRMRAAPCVWLETGVARRVDGLMRDYAHFANDAEAFCERLGALRALRGAETVARWQASARAGQTAEVVRELLVAHYDPIYRQSMSRHYAGLVAPLATLDGDAPIERAASELAAAVETAAVTSRAAALESAP